MHGQKRLFYFALRLPFAPSHNLLFAKECGFSFSVRSKSLRSNTGTSHRFKAFSPPFCAKSRFRLVPSENFAEISFDRALNRPRSPEVRKPLACFLCYFLHDAKSDNSFSLQRTSRFCEPRFSSPQWRLRTNKIKTFPKRASRFCKPRISTQNNNFAQAQLNPLPPCLLETWSPCSRPFAILPVSAVSDAQKLATGNFLHV